MSETVSNIKSRRLLAIFAAITVATFAGCGSQAYEQRLAETAKYYAYRQQVDSALERNSWQDYGIQMRLPKGFQEIPGPVEEDEHDERQPDFLSKPLPGLIGAWQTEVYVEIPDRESPSMPAWIFLCTNHNRFLNQQTDPTATPALLVEDLSNTLAAELRYEPDTALNRWAYEETRAPGGTPYVPRKTYESIMLDDERDIGEERVRMQFRLIRYYVDQIQFCLLTVTPHEEILDRQDRQRFYGINGALDLMMEQLVVSGEPPRQQRSGPAPSGGGF
jgi:hypothetical protein